MNAAQIIERVDSALAKGDETSAVAALEEVESSAPLTADQSRRLMLHARSVDRNDLALAAIAAGPQTADFRLIALQLRMEMGEAVADEIAAATSTSEPSAALLQLVGALDMEGRAAEAAAVLDTVVQANPRWVAGHQALLQLRWQRREPEPARSFLSALESVRSDELLLAAALGGVTRTLDWPLFDRLASDARTAFPSSQLIRMVCADGLSEAGNEEEADELFSSLTGVSDPDFDAARIRHAMRYSRFDNAARLGEQAVARHGAGECWAWLGAAWRVIGDPRSDWFHRGNELIARIDLDYPAHELKSLADCLRNLHSAAGPPLGQSPRGGSQTPGPLLKRSNPEIRIFRQKLREAIRRYIDGLPPVDRRHPFLAAPRRAFRFEGAWSIRLRPGGNHVPHIHSHGWISSAFYADLPAGMTEADDRQGWLQFGIPLLPDGAPVEPILEIAPKPGRLALFPSLFWHGTRPFETGERLTAAFDVVPR